MIRTSPFIKRIKRHITGPSHNFFIATLPGFEDLCKKELESLQFDAGEIKSTEGGVEFSGKLYDCILANMHLRTASRILMRVAEFNVTNFRKLDKKLKEIPWELYLREGCTPSIKVTAKHSRLYHSGAVSERIIESISEREKVAPFYSDGESKIQAQTTRYIQNIFVRLADDQITISLDSSGELLYKRGIKYHAGSAPIRETLAAAALLKTGYRGDEPLFDPMCGTGTFSIEAAMIARRIPPGWYRQFTFESWPGFKPARWAYLRKQAEKEIRVVRGKPAIIACDRDKMSCGALENTLKKYNMENIIKVLNNDFFSFTPDDIYTITGCKKPGLVIINPPYGIRLGTKTESRKLFINITRRLAGFFPGWKFALFSPEKDLIDKCGLDGEQTDIDHGGIRLTLFTGIIPKGN